MKALYLLPNKNLTHRVWNNRRDLRFCAVCQILCVRGNRCSCCRRTTSRFVPLDADIRVPIVA